MGQAQINVRTRACSGTFIARTKQVALTHNVRGKELTEHNREVRLTLCCNKWTSPRDSVRIREERSREARLRLLNTSYYHPLKCCDNVVFSKH